MKECLTTKELEDKLVSVPIDMKRKRMIAEVLELKVEADAVNLLIHALGIQKLHAENVKAKQKPFIAVDCTMLVREK